MFDEGVRLSREMSASRRLFVELLLSTPLTFSLKQAVLLSPSVMFAKEMVTVPLPCP